MEEIQEYANYCLNCPVKPCSKKGCPMGNDIPSFIKAVKEENYKEAYKILSETTVLPGVCGKICPHKKQCQGSCVRGIKGEPVDIGNIEAFIFQKALENGYTLKDEIGIEDDKVYSKDLMPNITVEENETVLITLKLNLRRCH